MHVDDLKANVVELMCAEHGYWLPAPSVVIVPAHPDDEVIGAGGRFRRLRGASFIHLTDGAPGNMLDAHRLGFGTREEYALARRRELGAALELGGLSLERCYEMGAADQELSLKLVDVTYQLADMLGELEPEAILTHAYEGGHPDHDAAAFCVHAACLLLQRDELTPPVLVEFTSYHAREDKMAVLEFLPNSPEEVTTVVLSEEDRTLKHRMVDCFVTQRETLKPFPITVERFRPAPEYDFTRPPHDGQLFYERFDWGMTGTCWRDLARKALDELGMEGPI